MFNLSLPLPLTGKKETNKTPQFRLRLRLLLLFFAARALKRKRDCLFFSPPLSLSRSLSLLLVQLGECEVGADVESKVEQEEHSHDLVFVF